MQSLINLRYDLGSGQGLAYKSLFKIGLRNIQIDMKRPGAKMYLRLITMERNACSSKQ